MVAAGPDLIWHLRAAGCHAPFAGEQAIGRG